MSELTASPRRHIIITLDYETWHPAVPPGKRIDWYETVIEPTAKLLEICDRYNAKLTIFFEIGEYYWLKEHRPAIARDIEEQLRGAVRGGHDVQLHLHTSWLPETGARYDEATDTWFWDSRYQKLHDYPGDITELLRRCKNDMETMLRPSNPDYRVTTFRAGAYQIQPSKTIVDALLAVGITADSSVWQGGYQPERGNDFRTAWSGQPYWADADDINHLSFRDKQLLEIPITTMRTYRSISNLPLMFLPKKVQRYFFDETDYSFMSRHLTNLNSNYPHEYIGVMIGHSKANLHYSDIERFIISALSKSVLFPTISSVVNSPIIGEITSRFHSSFSDIIAVCQEAYSKLSPQNKHRYRSGLKILQEGFAWCGGYARVAQYLLSDTGYRSKITTFYLEGLPFGRGTRGTDTHTVLEVLIPNSNKWVLCDAMANIVYPYSVHELQQNPELADSYLENIKYRYDERWTSRNYEWYSSSKAYSRITRIKHPNNLLELLITTLERLK